jgi:hypothetical protein
MQLLDDVTDGRVSRQRIENSILSELDYYATTPGKGLTSAQMSIVAEGAAEIRSTALPAGDYDAADAIRGRTWDRVAANANAQEESEADAGSVRVSPPRRICFELPPGASDEFRQEFERQLKEQQDAINNMTADEMGYANWVLRTAGTTRLLRDRAAQEAKRREYQQDLIAQGYSGRRLRQAMADVNATHFLDIVAGGDPSRVGIGGADVNQEIGRQWIQDGRVQQLRDEAEKMRREGRSQEKMNVSLEIC